MPRAKRVWVQLVEMFGKSVFREYGDNPPSLWVQAIAKLSDKELSKGLANLGNAGLEFPPNLSQFIGACRKAEPLAPWRTLPPPDVDAQAEADKAWAEMERLAGKSLR